MTQILNILKQRRVWASILTLVAILLPKVNIDPNTIINSVINVIEAISSLGAVLLPIWSYLKPKN